MSRSSSRVYVRSGGPIYFIFAVCTAIIGHAIHHSIFWSIVDFFFWPIAWVKWLICHEVYMSVIKSAFSFFFR